MKKIETLFFVLLGVPVLLALQGCWMMADIGDHGHGTDADSDSDTDSDTDSDSETICEEVSFPLLNDPARVLILLDHSSSMEGENWNIARNAIDDLLTTFASSSLEFGLDTLPDPEIGECSVSAPVAIDCGPGTEDEIHDVLAGMPTFVSTPLYGALSNFLDPDYAPGCTAAEHRRNILLVADGEDSCSSPTIESFADLTSALVATGIDVMVVGFNVNIDAAQLDAIAANGGTEFTTFLNASDGPSLTAALSEIAGSIDSCFFTVSSAAASAAPGLVNFYIGGVIVPMDEDCSTGTGWRWVDEEHTQVEFCADLCALLESGAVGDLTATFGCETVVGS